MKERKKLSLNQLVITSFITSINDNYLRTIIGGVDTKNPNPPATNDLQPCVLTNLAQHCTALTMEYNTTDVWETEVAHTTECFSIETEEVGLCLP